MSKKIELPPSWGLKEREDFRDLFKRIVAMGVDAGLPDQEAEDCAGDALLRAWERREQFRPGPGQTFRNWSLAIGRNCVRDLLRRRLVEIRARSAPEVVEHDTRPTSAEVVTKQARKRRWQLKGRLTAEEPQFLDVWVAQHARDIDARTAATTLDLTIPEYEARKKRLRRKLDDLMKELRFETDDVAPEPEVITVRAGEGEGEDDNEMG